MPLNDLGPGSLLAGLLLPLSLTDVNGTMEVTVLAHDAGGCDTIVSPSVVVTVVPPSLVNLADQYAVSDGPPGAGDGSGSGSASSTNLSGAIFGSACVFLCLGVTPSASQERGIRGFEVDWSRAVVSPLASHIYVGGEGFAWSS